MNRIAIALLPCLLLISSPAWADVTIDEKVLQKGIFSPPKCNNESGCLCEADIKYPVIGGMKDLQKETQINADILKSAEQIKCEGAPVQAANTGDNFSITHSYEVTFKSPEVLGLKFSETAYEGGAHGNSTIEGMIIDLDTGNVLSIKDIFGDSNIPAINQIIYDTLIPKAEGVFHDEVEGRKGSFIKDGKCQGCTILVNKEGIQVVFQAYEVAPFADGNPAVTIPAKYITYKALKK